MNKMVLSIGMTYFFIMTLIGISIDPKLAVIGASHMATIALINYAHEKGE